MPVDEVSDGFSVRYGPGLALPLEVEEALTRRQAAHEAEALTDDAVGREIARLESERERLLDVIWLATSPTQIRALWTKVAELLGDEPTQLEREALAARTDRGAVTTNPVPAWDGTGAPGRHCRHRPVTQPRVRRCLWEMPGRN